MGDKDKEKSVHHDDKKQKGHDVDTDAEHNKAISRRTSNADLKKQAHDGADSSSMSGVQAAMGLLSREMYDGTLHLKGLIHSDTSGDAGAEPAIQQIHELYERVLSDASRVNDLIGTVDKATARFLAPEVKKAQGTAFMFVTHMHRAASWITEQPGHEHDERLDDQRIRSIIEGYTSAVGLEGELDQDRHAPEGDEMQLTKQLVHDEVDALEAAITSAGSGNSEDVGRIVLHARMLDNFAKEHGLALKSAHSRLVSMQAALNKIRSERQDDRLNEAAFHVSGLISRHN